MRYSVFGGLPLGMLVFAAVYELASRLTTDGAATMAGLAGLAMVVLWMHRWDELRLQRLLRPEPQLVPVDAHTAREFIVETLQQVEFADAEGFRARWRLSMPPSEPERITGKITVRSRVVNLNVVAWFLDLLDKGWQPRTIQMQIELTPAGGCTEVAVSYDMPRQLDWSRCEEVIGENNQWIEQSLSRAALMS